MLHCTRLRRPCQATHGQRAPQNPPPIATSPSSALPFPISRAPLCSRRMLGKRCVCGSRPRHAASPVCGGACHAWDGLSRLGWGHELGQAGLILSMRRRHRGQAPEPPPRDEDIAQLALAEGRGPWWVPATEHGEANSFLCVLPFSSPHLAFGSGAVAAAGGAPCRGRAAKPRQPPTAPRPPVPRLVAGRRAACAWQGSVSCWRIPVPRSLPISLRAGTAGGSGGTGREGWGGRIVKGREEKKK